MEANSIPDLMDSARQYHQSGWLHEAEMLYREILTNDPNHADALDLLGVVALQRGQRGEAQELVRKAIAIAPLTALYHSHLGMILLENGEYEQAAAAFGQSVALAPDSAEDHDNLGIALTRLGRLAAAREAFQRAIVLQPNLAEAHSNLGNVLRECNDLDGAVAHFQAAIRLSPRNPAPHNNLGLAYMNLDSFDQAASAFREALALRPDYPEAHANLAILLRDVGRLDEALQAYRNALQSRPSDSSTHGAMIGVMQFLPERSAEANLREARTWAQRHADPLPKFTDWPHVNREPQRPLRVGYVSPDLHTHSVSYFFESLLENHNRANVEAVCYANQLQSDQVTARLKHHAAEWRDIVGLPDERVAEMILGDRIDILVDLAGHTGGNRLLVFARKPAPVQVTYLGYPGTTGLSPIDYRITDAWADPPSAGLPAESPDAGYTERLVRLPRTFLCYRPPDDSPPCATAASIERPFTFGCFNALPKISLRVMAMWCSALHRVPGSRLLIKCNGARYAEARRRLLSCFTSSGIGEDRVTFLAHVPSATEHLAHYHRVDVALDTFPYHGTTTTCEALWMGVPVVTLAGTAHVSRVGVSLLTSVGLADLIATSPESYVEIAERLSKDASRRGELRATLRQRMQSSALMDGPDLARAIEAAYRVMWLTWCQRMN